MERLSFDRPLLWASVRALQTKAFSVWYNLLFFWDLFGFGLGDESTGVAKGNEALT